MNNADAPPVAPRADNPVLLFKALLVLLALSGLDQTLLGTLLPTLAKSLGHAELAPWVFTSYLLASTIAVPLYGKLADRFGPWPMLLISAGLFTLGSAACAGAPNMPVLVVARGLQGLGGGGLMTLALLTTVWLCPPAERGRRMGSIGLTYSAATLIGPLAGGVLVKALSWHWAFLLNVPCAALAWGVIHRNRFGSRAAEPARFDLLGAVLLGGALAALLWAIRCPIGSAEGTVAAVVAANLLIGWFMSSRRAADPIVPLGLFGDRAFRGVAGLSALSGIVLFGVVVFMPLYLQNGVHLDALESATCTLPLMAGIALAAQGAGRFIATGRPLRPLAIFAGALMTAGTLAVFVALRWGPAPCWALAAASLPIGLGLGVCFPVTSLIAQRRAPSAQLGAASALPVMLRTLGGSLAVAVLGDVLHRHMGAAAGAGFASHVEATEALAEGTVIVFLWLSLAAALALLLVTRLREQDLAVSLPAPAMEADQPCDEE